jgi:hypothetical protein
MQFASNLPHPRRSMAIPLMAAAVLGAGIATATFALVNIEDEPIVSLPTPAGESAAVPSDAVAGQRDDGAAAVGIPSPAAAAKMNVEAGSGTASKDEAGTAAAISQSNDMEHRGSKASATGSGSSDTTIQADPQGDKP